MQQVHGISLSRGKGMFKPIVAYLRGMFRRAPAMFALAAYGLTTPAQTQEIFGFERVIVDDGVERQCINAETDHISVRISDIVIHKNDQWPWIRETKEVDIVMQGKLERIVDNTLERRHGEMPVVFRADLRDYANGVVIAPVELILLSRFPLRVEDQSTNALEIDFSFINHARPTALARIAARLPDATRGLPLPPSPYTAGFSMATQVVGELLGAVFEENDDDSFARQGRISLEFNDTGRCGRNGAYSGTYAFIRSHDLGTRPGLVSLDQIGQHCFFKAANSRAVLVEREVDGECSFDPASANRLLNPHFTFILSIANGGGDEPIERDILQSDLALQRSRERAQLLREQLADPQASSGELVAALKRGVIPALEGGAQAYATDPGALEMHFSVAGRDMSAALTTAQGWEFTEELVEYLPQEGRTSIVEFQQGGNVEGVEVLPEAIILSTAARCSEYGLDPHACY